MGKSKLVLSHRELEVFNKSFSVAMELFTASKAFPKEERFALTNQVRRSSRSVCANLAEAWRRRRYRAAFIAKLSDAEGEAAESQVWIEFAVKCDYLTADSGRAFYQQYEQIIRMLVAMINTADQWVIDRPT